MVSQLMKYGKISRSTESPDMINIKKAAQGFSSKLGLLNKHRSLVIAHTEEKKVQEALFKLVLSRVNSSTSILRWATDEKNSDLKDNICRLYDVNLMWATVQKNYIEENSALMTSLKDILHIEAGLDALQKHLKEVTDKKERLLQRVSDGVRKKTEKVETITDEIAKLVDEEESLKSELEVKTLKAEIFKGRSLKSALQKVVRAHLQLSEKMKLIFEAMEKIVDDIQDVPEHLKLKKNKDNEGPELIPTEDNIVSDLAEQLNIDCPSSTLTRNIGKSPSAAFHVEMGQNGVKLNLQANQQKSYPQKKISGTKITSGFKKMFGIGNSTANVSEVQTPPEEFKSDITSAFNFDYVMVSNSSPPKLPLPEIPQGLRRRSKSNIIPPTFIRRPAEKKSAINEASESDDEDYILPNTNLLKPKASLTRERSKSESKLDDLPGDGYSRPWDLPRPATSEYQVKEGTTSTDKYSYAYQHFKARPSEADDSFSTYQNPKDCIIQAGMEDIYTEFNGNTESNSDEEGLYDSPYDMREQVAALQREYDAKKSSEEESADEEIYENSLKLLDEIEYIDTSEMRKIQSRPDTSSGQIIVEKKFPLPIPRPQPGNNTDVKKGGGLDKKDISGPIILDDHPSINDRKMIPVKPIPTPRPNAKFGVPKPPYSKNLVKALSTDQKGSTDNLKDEIKARPFSAVLNITQTKLSNEQEVQYENNFSSKI